MFGSFGVPLVVPEPPQKLGAEALGSMQSNAFIQAFVAGIRQRALAELLRGAVIKHAGGDPDGALVPLPVEAPPERVLAAFPGGAYRALTGG